MSISSATERTMGRYRLLSLLARGGMGEVWVAQVQGPLGFGRQVVVKKIREDRTAEPTYHKMLVDEARLVSKIRHPNVITTIDVLEAGGELAIVFEHVDGVSLDRLAREQTARPQQRMAVSTVLRIMIGTCRGLHAAHELRGEDGRLLDLVHRDISPQNILVSRYGEVKVIDFGIAKDGERSRGMTASGALRGKVRYMAPEQATGLKVDRRADVWATGSVLYWLLSGNVPFDAPSDVQILAQLLQRAEIPELPEDCPPRLRAAVARCLEHDPSKRFSTSGELADELTAIGKGLGAVFLEGELQRELADLFASMDGSATRVRSDVSPRGSSRNVAADNQPTRSTLSVAHPIAIAKRSRAATFGARTMRIAAVAAVAAAVAAGVTWGLVPKTTRAPGEASKGIEATAPSVVQRAPATLAGSADHESSGLASAVPTLSGMQGAAPKASTARPLAGGWAPVRPGARPPPTPNIGASAVPFARPPAPVGRDGFLDLE